MAVNRKEHEADMMGGSEAGGQGLFQQCLIIIYTQYGGSMKLDIRSRSNEGIGQSFKHSWFKLHLIKWETMPLIR